MLLKIYNNLSLLFLSILLVGCASAPTADELNNADYGKPISIQNAEKKALSFLDGILKDPESSKVKWGAFSTSWIRKPIIRGGQLVFGYKLGAKINSKNSYGGYTGYKPYIFMFRNEKLILVYALQTSYSRYGSSEMYEQIYP